MSRLQRIISIIVGVISIAGGVLIILVPDPGYLFIVFILSISLILFGVRKILYYFTMARYMAGGKMMLYMGVIILDAGIFVFALTDVPIQYIMIYLIGMHAVSGMIELLRAFEEKKMEDPSWKWKFISAIINLLIAVACIVFIGSTSIAVIIYGAGLIYSGIVRIITAFRRTEVLYIQ